MGTAKEEVRGETKVEKNAREREREERRERERERRGDNWSDKLVVHGRHQHVRQVNQSHQLGRERERERRHKTV